MTERLVTKSASQLALNWSKLMDDAIRVARRNDSNHLPGLMAAQAQGKHEAFLRRLGVISDADITRIFEKL